MSLLCWRISVSTLLTSSKHFLQLKKEDSLVLPLNYSTEELHQSVSEHNMPLLSESFNTNEYNMLLFVTMQEFKTLTQKMTSTYWTKHAIMSVRPVWLAIFLVQIHHRMWEVHALNLSVVCPCKLKKQRRRRRSVFVCFIILISEFHCRTFLSLL